MLEEQTATREQPRGDARPAVSVVVPFLGGPEEARSLIAAVGRLELREGDEVIVADNTPEGLVGELAGPDLRVVAALGERSSYYARNAGAEQGRNEWILFMDADCRPTETLLDDYFAESPGERCGVVAGEVVGAPEQDALTCRWVRSRSMLSPRYHLERGPYPAGVTANLLVRREAWESVGGFQEGIRSGADLEFCWRSQELGWPLEYRPRACVEHIHPDRLVPLLRKAVRYGAGQLWVGRRYRGAGPRPGLLRELARSVGGALFWALTARPQRALFKLLDGVWTLAYARGYYLGDNRAERSTPADPRDPEGRPSLLVLTDGFPARSETFVYNQVQALTELGWRVRVESNGRSKRPERAVAREVALSHLEDEPLTAKLRDLVWLVGRHPIRAIRDLRDRRRWRQQEEVWALSALAPAARRLARSKEEHIHVHFAATASLHALRLARLLDLPYSVTAYAYEVYQQPRNLREKLEAAAFATSDSEYTAANLRALVAPERRDWIRALATGVDARSFRRRRPHPGGRTVVAVGRLIEKKGFRHLIQATALLERREPLERVIIAGDGPLRERLTSEVERLGLGGRVELRGNVWAAEAVRELLEEADLLAIPSVIASDGDRDSMPVVAYEALAMEVPVLASDLVGLPEVIRPELGRLVPPGEPEALAAAIAELLALEPSERAAMGAAGRALVTERFDLRRTAAELGRLIQDSHRVRESS